MQKKIIALAVAGLVSGSAFAQSNVTIYGIVDVGVTYVDADGKNGGWAIDNGLLSGSRLGFKGTEDLGGGLKAVYTLEYMLQPDDNTALGATGPWTGSATRQSYVGFSSDKWGTLVGGRLQGAGYNFACSYNPVAGGAFDTIGKLALTTTLSCGSGGRSNNAVAWVSPSWSGFSLEYNHARITEEATRGVAIASPALGANDNVDDNYANLFAATYANGPLKIGGIYSNVSRRANNGITPITTTTSVGTMSFPTAVPPIVSAPFTSTSAAGGAFTGTDNDITEWGLGGEYDFKVAKIYGSYVDQDVDNTPGASGKKWQLSVSFPVFTAGSIALSYADSDVDAANADASAYAILFTYNMSKRTTLYTGYSAVNNDGVASTRGIVTATSATNGIGQPRADGNASVFAAGVRHSF